eukprot:TRINITY_DN76591_c0_g1_i1.p1 TRINITY_DN76591_c0_g1~~TRINITY_DN76591_c0_g1_i1.p1  ORF type:complete len:335 (+),score=55.60 TRINITY_DN76591_c0_g1_i1:24-1007(+)
MADAASKWRPAVALGAGAVVIAAWLKSRRRSGSGIRISELRVHPIKSCRGLSVVRAVLMDAGLAHDREYAIIKVTDGKAVALTQREMPALATIVPDMPTDDGMLIRHAGMHSPLHVSPAGQSHGKVHNISYHEWWDVVQGEDQGEEAARWLAEALDDREVRLVRFVGERPTPEPETFGEGRTLFSDGFSMLLVSEASLADVGARSGLSNMSERMRPNIVVTGCDAFEEDSWSSLIWQRDSASARLLLPKPCARCCIPRVEPRTGVPGPDPLRVMKAYRSGRELLKTTSPHKAHYEMNKGEIFFGQNVNAVVSGQVVLCVGDALHVEK